MPVYDYTYQSWTGERRGPVLRWLTIPKFTYMEFLHNRAFIMLFVLSWFQFLIRLSYIYLLANKELLDLLKFPVSQLFKITPFFFRNMIDIQLPLCFICAFQMGANLISRDLRHNAAVLYYSKPISRWEYFVGKFVTLFSVTMLLTWIQTMLLYVVWALINHGRDPFNGSYWDEFRLFPLAITVYSTVASAVLSLMILAASSLTKNARYAGTSFIAVIIGLRIAAGIIFEISRHNIGSSSETFRFIFAISPADSVIAVGYHLFHTPDGVEASMSASVAWVGCVGVCAVCGLILKWRLSRAARLAR